MGNRDFHILLPVGLDTLSERQYQRHVVEIAAYYGWVDWYHTAFSLKSVPGFPDLVFFNPEAGGSIYLEVKVKRNKPTVEQCDWLSRIRQAGIHAYVTHPHYAILLPPLFNGEVDPPAVGTGDVAIDYLPVSPELPALWEVP